MNMYTAIIAINPITARQCLRTVIFSNFIAEPIPFRLAKHLCWIQQIPNYIMPCKTIRVHVPI